MAADPITARLIALRKQRGYTQQQLADLSDGVSRSCIARAEANGTCYSIPTALLLAPVFGLELALVERSQE